MELPPIPKSAEELQAHASPDKLAYYAFIWSEMRLVLGAIALLAGGIPVLRLVVPFQFLGGIVGLLLTIAWLLSGAAAAYLAYRWYTGGKKLFGGEDKKDLAAFALMIASGLNLGITGLSGKNIGMTIFSSQLAFGVTALAYLAAALYLYWRWNAAGKKIV